MNTFTEIVERIKEELKLETDKELYLKLGMSSTAFSERKRTDSIPHDKILNLCISEKMNINKIYSDYTPNMNYQEENIKIIKNLELNEQKKCYHLLQFHFKK